MGTVEKGASIRYRASSRIGLIIVLFVTLLGIERGYGQGPESDQEKSRLRRAIGVPKPAEVTVEQDKIYTRKGRFELAPFIGYTPNDPLVYFFTFGVFGSYFISELWGLEAAYGFNIVSETQLLKDLEAGRRSENGQVVNVGVSRTKQFFSGGMTFHPLYGKLSLFAYRTVHYDAFLAAGAGASITTTKTLDPSTTPNTFESDEFYRLNTYIGIGWRTYINSYLTVRIDVRDYIVFDRVQKPTNQPSPRDVQHDLMVSLGMSVLFPFKGK